MTLDRHAADATLEQYSLGMLSEREAAEVEEHVLICPSCQERLAETDAYVDAMRQAALKLGTAAPPVWRHRLDAIARLALRPLPLAAAVAGIAAILWLGGSLRLTRAPALPPVSVFLAATRGGEAIPVSRAPSGRALSLKLDTAGLPQVPACHVEIVNARGRAVFQSPARAASGTLTVEAPALGGGSYWVRLYDPQMILLREFGLEVE